MCTIHVHFLAFANFTRTPLWWFLLAGDSMLKQAETPSPTGSLQCVFRLLQKRRGIICHY